MIVYLDILFVMNFIMNYIVLVIASSFGGIYTKKMKIIFSAFVGALYAVFTFFSYFDFLNILIVKLIFGTIITVLAFGFKKIIKNTVLVLIISSAIAGIVMSVSLVTHNENYMMISGVPYIDVKLDTLAVVFILSYVGISVIHKGLFKNKTENICDIHIIIGNKSKKIAVFCDTGNVLTYNGMPVIIVEITELRDIIPDELRCLLRSGEYFNNPVSRRVKLIHYKTISSETGIMLAFKPDKILDKNKKEIHALIGISYEKLSINGASALMGV